MNLNNFDFIIKFIVIVVVMLLLQSGRIKDRNAKIFSFIQLTFLLACSFYFIAMINPLFLLCIVFVIGWTYSMGIIVGETHSKLMLTGGAAYYF